MILHSVVYVANLSIVQVCDSIRHKACNQLATELFNTLVDSNSTLMIPNRCTFSHPFWSSWYGTPCPNSLPTKDTRLACLLSDFLRKEEVYQGGYKACFSSNSMQLDWFSPQACVSMTYESNHRRKDLLTVLRLYVQYYQLNGTNILCDLMWTWANQLPFVGPVN